MNHGNKSLLHSLATFMVLIPCLSFASDGNPPAPVIANVPKPTQFAPPNLDNQGPVNANPPAAGPLNCQETVSENIPAPTDSPNLQYFKDLRAQATQNPTGVPLSAYLKLWYPDAPSVQNMDSPFFQCEDSPGQAFTQTPSVRDQCKPDILYSWHDHIWNILNLFPNNPDSTWSGDLNPNGNIGDIAPQVKGVMFCSISPVSTSAYGTNLLRLKIKAGTRYNFEDFGANNGEVGIRTDTYHDFSIRDSSLVESISTGTYEIYDEVVRDIIRFQSGQRVSDYNFTGSDGFDRFLNQMEDNHSNTEEDLKAKLLNLLGQILDGQGQIHYNKGVCRSRQLTFSTRFPSYYEPALSPAH